MIRVLLTGATGQLGLSLRASCPRHIHLIPSSRSGGDGLQTLDLADAAACRAIVRELQPDWVLNAGAYTAVDQAEREPGLAQAVNADAPAAFAEALKITGGRLLQISTDFVFDGGQGYPYQPDQAVNPISVYGKSKAAGEAAVQDVLPDGQICILRTSWVYGPVGRNFLRTMLRLHRERSLDGTSLAVVSDQLGCPTATPGLASACWAALDRQLSGIHHWCDAGVASWYDFAVAIGELGQAAGVLERAARVEPIPTSSYPTPARRPSYSLLDCASTRAWLALPAVHWRQALRQVMAQLIGI